MEEQRASGPGPTVTDAVGSEPTVASPPGDRYAAFASYSAKIDIAVAKDIEDFLEGLGENRLVDQRYRRKLEVCRDGSDFAARRRRPDDPVGSQGLLDVIRGYLRLSDNLIVFVGPNSKGHPWILAELDIWLTEHGLGGVLVCLTHGDDLNRRYDQLFPSAVVENQLHEPYYFDFRGFGASARANLKPRPTRRSGFGSPQLC